MFNFEIILLLIRSLKYQFGFKRLYSFNFLIKATELN